MRYRCDYCGASQWRGLIPPAAAYLRFAVLHGVALGVCSAATRALFARLGHTTDGWCNGPASLAVCAVLMFALYGAVILTEAGVVAALACRGCGRRGLRPASPGEGDPGEESPE